MTQECQIATVCREEQWRKSIIGAWFHMQRGMALLWPLGFMTARPAGSILWSPKKTKPSRKVVK